MSVRWDGQIETPLAEPYTLFFNTSSGIRVWIHDTLMIDAFSNTQPNEFTVHIAVVPSHFHDIRIELTTGFQESGIRMYWESTRQEKEIVPALHLYQNNETVTVTPRAYSITLHEGWNFVSIGFEPEERAISQIFHNATMVKNDDNFYDSSLPSMFNTMQEIESGKAYLINNSTEETISITALPYIVKTDTLQAGWNLIGYPYASGCHKTEALNELGDNLHTIKNFDAYYLSDNPLSNLNELEPNKGYFIKVNEDAILAW